MTAEPKEKVAVSLPAGVVRRAHEAIRAGQARSLSAYVSAALEEKQHADDLSAALEAMDAALGPPTQDDVRWAKSVLDR
jgi:Arc/MetJ-type ribon-helix-helix transcriptional regulator